MNVRSIIVCIAIAVTFMACGENSGSETAAAQVSEVESLYDIGKCTDNRKGESVFVIDENAYFICVNSKWSKVDVEELNESSSSAKGKTSSSNTNKSNETSSSAKEKKSSSSIDTENESSDEDDACDESACDRENHPKSSSIFADESSSSSENSSKSSSSEFLTTDFVKNKTIKGFVQKGPMVNGFSIILRELDDKTLAQTGKTFKGDALNSKGEFAISNVTLTGQSALLEATGYYLNEVTGKKSESPITLRALLTDLGGEENVNINLLTHLEYDRVLYLVSSGLEMASAKKQAELEILKAFGLEKNFDYAENLNIFGSSNGDSVLLAFSILMQGNRSEAELSEMLANFASDFEDDGLWNDEQMKADIADDASLMELDEIRSSLEGFNVGNIPNFETIINKFWWGIYGLNACGLSNEAKIEQNSNSKSKNFQKNYVCENGNWRTSTRVEDSIGVCSSKNIDDVAIYSYWDRVRKESRFFAMQCVDTGWTEISPARYDTLALKCSTNGKIVHSDLTDGYYICKSGKITSLTYSDLNDNKTGSGNLWDWTKGALVDVVEDADNPGTWWAEGDYHDKGNSYFTNSSGDKETSSTFSFLDDSEVTSNKGIFFGYKLDPSVDNAYVETGFVMTEPSPQYIDISSWNGLCIVYESSAPFKLGIMHNAELYGYDYNMVVVPASISTVVRNFEWNQFTQGGWGSKKNPVESAVKESHGIMMHYTTSLSPSLEGVVLIKAIGKLNDCSVN